MEPAWGAVSADLDGDGCEEAGGDQTGAVGVKIEERVGGLAVSDAVLIPELDDRVGKSRALLGGVDLLVHGGERVPAPVGIVVLDRFAQPLEIGADQLGQRDQEPRWKLLLAETGSSSGRGRPTIPMETYARLMLVKHRSGWGYETLMREVSDSIHLRRFCRIGLSDRVPDESTVRKLTRRLGAEVVHEITREVIQKARREKRFRPRAARIDSTVVDADVRWPTDAGLAADGVRALAREGRKLAAKIRRDAQRSAIARGRSAASCAR